MLVARGCQCNVFLSSQLSGRPPFKASVENYLLIVTFKELYLGNGRDFYETMAKEKIDALLADDGQFPIPLEHIYFITVDDLDHLANCVKEGVVRFTELLRKAVSDDQVHSSKKFHFRQHLISLGKDIGIPKYLDEEINNISDRIRSLLDEEV